MTFSPAILFLIALSLCIAATLALPNMAVSEDEFISLKHDDCERIAYRVIQQALNEYQPGLDLTQPMDFYVEAPFDDLKYINITDFHIDEYKIEDCHITPDEHGYKVHAEGISVKSHANFEYDFPAFHLHDNGTVHAEIKDARLDILIIRLPNATAIAASEEDVSHSIAEEESTTITTPSDHANLDHTFYNHVDGDSNDKYTAIVATNIQWLKLDFSHTPYADFYNKLAKEHNAALRLIVSLMTNDCIKHYIEDGLDGLDDSIPLLEVFNEVAEDALVDPHHHHHIDNIVH